MARRQWANWTRRLVNTVSCRSWTMCNLANLDAAMGGGLLGLIEVHLLAVGGGPTLDYADARHSSPGSRP